MESSWIRHGCIGDLENVKLRKMSRSLELFDGFTLRRTLVLASIEITRFDMIELSLVSEASHDTGAKTPFSRLTLFVSAN